MGPGATWPRSGGVQRSERTRGAHAPTKHRMGLRAHTFVRPALRQREPFPHHLLIMVAQRGVKGGGTARRSLVRACGAKGLGHEKAPECLGTVASARSCCWGVVVAVTPPKVVGLAVRYPWPLC